MIWEQVLGVKMLNLKLNPIEKEPVLSTIVHLDRD